ncbi:hypothetical protein AVEN_38684-1 [Araneus ventricosus]|uniref:Uncharacterized protein n=1 Tax=Araneus ventricosus TaxID=182803 RepID=A0A4Y2TAR2_ARAVE|nr:hypothetical protein AVEN_38684-1 [Araneus ventricosus]
MTRTTPELAPPLQTSTPHQREDGWPLRMNWRAACPISGGSSVESGFGPGALRPQSRDLNTRLQQPFGFWNSEDKNKVTNWFSPLSPIIFDGPFAYFSRSFQGPNETSSTFPGPSVRQI